MSWESVRESVVSQAKGSHMFGKTPGWVAAMGVCGATSGIRAQPWKQVDVLQPLHSDHFGVSVSISGDTAVIGADFDSGHGAAYIYREIDSRWVEEAKLSAGDPQPLDLFGFASSISGDTAVVGARFHGVNHVEGAAYIFRRQEGNWQQVAKITSGRLAETFGSSVAIDGGMVVVGAAAAGHAYVFEEIQGEWQMLAQLEPDGGAESVAISGGTVLVGTRWASDAGDNSGSAFVYRERNGIWQVVVKLEPDDLGAGDQLGASVSLHDDVAIVGAIKADAGASDSGASHVFREIDGAWQQVAKLVPKDPAQDANFGWGTFFDGTSVIVGAPDNVDAVGLEYGAAYVFREIDGAWRQVAKLVADEPEGGSFFGFGVAVRGQTAIVGAELADSQDGKGYVFSAGCPGDFNGDGDLNVLDFVAFQIAWVAEDPSANCDLDGEFTIEDFICFQNAFANGCP